MAGYKGADLKKPFILILLIASVIQLLLAVGIHISAYARPMLLAVLGTVALVLTVLAATVWEEVRALRLAARILPLIAAAGLLLLGVLSVAQTMASPEGAGNDLGYTMAQYAALVLMYGQMLLVFLIPVAVAASAHGQRADRVILRCLALANTAIVLYFTLYAFDNSAVLRAFDILTDWRLGRWLYFAFTLAVTAVTFLPFFPKKAAPSPAKNAPVPEKSVSNKKSDSKQSS